MQLSNMCKNARKCLFLQTLNIPLKSAKDICDKGTCRLATYENTEKQQSVAAKWYAPDRLGQISSEGENKNKGITPLNFWRSLISAPDLCTDLQEGSASQNLSGTRLIPD